MCVHPIRGELAALYEAAGDGILFVDGQTGRILRGNPAARRMLGCEENDLVSTPIAEIFPDSQRQPILSLFTSLAAEHGRRSEKDVALHRKDNGATIFVEVTVAEAGHNDRPCAVVFLRNVTEQHDLRMVVDVQHEMANALGDAKDLNAPLSRFIDLVLRMPGMDCGGVYLTDVSTGDLNLFCHRGVSPQFVAQVSHFAADSIEVRQASLGKPSYDRSEEGVEPHVFDAALREGIRSTALIPVMYRNNLLGMLSFASHTRDEIPECTRRALEDIGFVIGGMIARIRTETSLLTTESRARLILERALDGFAIVDLGGFVREANHAYSKMVGYLRDELTCMHVADLEADHTRDAVADQIAQIRRAGAGRFQTRHRHKDGTVIDVDVSVHCCPCGAQDLLFVFIRDIGKQRQMEQALHETEYRYGLIADNVSDVIWTATITLSPVEKASLLNGRFEDLADHILDRWRFSFVSPSATRAFGYSPEEVQSLSLRHLATPATAAKMRESLIERLSEPRDKAPRAASPTILELEIICKDGSTQWCESVSTYMRDEAGWPASVLGITRDITKRRQAENALRESEAKLRGLFENLPDIVILVDRNADILYVNRSIDNTAPTALLNVNAFGFLVPESHPACRAAFDASLATGRTQVVESLDRTGRWWTCRVVPIKESGVFEHVMVICTNITEQRAAREAVQKEQQLLRRLLDLHEQDRQITAYDIHDGFVQYLAGALFRLQAFQETLARDPAAAWEALETAQKMVRKAMDDARRLISGLRPPILDEAGIVEAVEYLVCESRQPGGPEIDFAHDVAFDRVAPPLETAVFRIVQESLRNACRYSRSPRILVNLVERDRWLFLEIRDWGVGFNPDRVAEQRFGLQGIRERVRLLGGRITIESAANAGTRIAVELPMLLLND